MCIRDSPSGAQQIEDPGASHKSRSRHLVTRRLWGAAGMSRNVVSPNKSKILPLTRGGAAMLVSPPLSIGVTTNKPTGGSMTRLMDEHANLQAACDLLGLTWAQLAAAEWDYVSPQMQESRKAARRILFVRLRELEQAINERKDHDL